MDGYSPANPITVQPYQPPPSGINTYTGLTARQTFAMHFMAGLLASRGSLAVSIDEMADQAVRAADAMIGRL